MLTPRKDKRTIAAAYDIYIYHGPDTHAGRPWERCHTTQCVKQARQHAEELHQTNTYPRIEIKMKYFDSKKDRAVNRTLKIYEKNKRKSLHRIVAIGLALLCAVILGGLVYTLFNKI